MVGLESDSVEHGAVPAAEIGDEPLLSAAADGGVATRDARVGNADLAVASPADDDRRLAVGGHGREGRTALRRGTDRLEAQKVALVLMRHARTLVPRPRPRSAGGTGGMAAIIRYPDPANTARAEDRQDRQRQ